MNSPPTFTGRSANPIPPLTVSTAPCKLGMVAIDIPDLRARYLQVFVAVPDQESGQLIATALVRERLAACVQLTGPVRSVYRWQGSIEDSAEFLCLAKTSEERIAALKQRVAELHPYEVPEIVALPIIDGSRPYLAWLAESLDPEADQHAGT